MRNKFQSGLDFGQGEPSRILVNGFLFTCSQLSDINTVTYTGVNLNVYDKRTVDAICLDMIEFTQCMSDDLEYIIDQILKKYDYMFEEFYK